MSLPPLRYDPPRDPWLTILYEDRDMLVVNKQSGLLSVPGRTGDLFDSVLSRARRTHPQAQAVHRLDLGTSGVLVVATRRKAEAALRQQFQERRTRKAYLALVAGILAYQTGTIDRPLICDWPNRPRQKICLDTGKPAVTDFTLIEQHAATALVRLCPRTGRSHQLRVHMASIGHPILGDNLYGEAASADRLLLHAAQLGLFHPYSEQWMTFHAPCTFAPHVEPMPLEPPIRNN